MCGGDGKRHATGKQLHTRSDPKTDDSLHAEDVCDCGGQIFVLKYRANETKWPVLQAIFPDALTPPANAHRSSFML